MLVEVYDTIDLTSYTILSCGDLLGGKVTTDHDNDKHYHKTNIADMVKQSAGIRSGGA